MIMPDAIKITILCDSKAFRRRCDAEVAWILRDLADKIERGEEPDQTFDKNGEPAGCVFIYSMRYKNRKEASHDDEKKDT